MIYDKGKIFLGLAIFLALVASPFWYNPVFGTGSSRCGGAQAASDDDDVLSERPEEPTTAKPTNHWLRYIAV